MQPFVSQTKQTSTYTCSLVQIQIGLVQLRNYGDMIVFFLLVSCQFRYNKTCVIR